MGRARKLAELAAAYDGGALMFRNRIINGDMRIDQRNGGSSITANDDTYAVDRFKTAASQSSKLTAQRNAAAVTPPAGFANYLGYTSSSAYSVTSTDYFVCQQSIEGFNAADLAWGSANAKSITLSFWVRSSLTGTFGGAIRNAATDRSYPFTYTISAANTWEQKSIAIAGDTSGTWGTGNGVGISLGFGLGAGATPSGTPGAWATGAFRSATGAVSVVGTNAATWYVTGVQIEVGDQTPFERRHYGLELALCQRYFRALKSGLIGFWASATAVRLQCTWPGMRTTPTFSQSGTLTVTDNSVNATQSSVSVTDNGSDADGGQIIIGNVSGGTANRVAAVLSSSAGSVLVSAEL